MFPFDTNRITLQCVIGYFEKDDLDCVIKHLRDSGKTSTIALWGRSMGAATALLHGMHVTFEKIEVINKLPVFFEDLVL